MRQRSIILVIAFHPRDPNGSHLAATGLPPDLPCDAQMIFPQDFSNIELRVAPAQHGFNDFGRLLDADHSNSLGVTFRWKDVGVVFEKVVQLLLVKHVVEAQSDVIGSDQLHEVVDVVHDGLGPIVIVSQKVADANN